MGKSDACCFFIFNYFYFPRTVREVYKHNKRRTITEICGGGPEKPIRTDRLRPTLIAQDLNLTALAVFRNSLGFLPTRTLANAYILIICKFYFLLLSSFGFKNVNIAMSFKKIKNGINICNPSSI